MKRCLIIIFLVILFAPFSFVVCGEQKRETVSPWLVFNWAEADQLFQKDRYWMGGDGGYSIDLSEGRVLWLFGDSWINPSGNRARNGATMVSNSVAIQRGYDPSRATIEFYWGGKSTHPEAFFPDTDGVRYWPGHGLLLEDRLILFLLNVHKIDEGLGFEVRDWSAVLVTNPRREPSEWEVRWLSCPQNRFNIIVGSGSVLAQGEYVYAFGAREPGPKQDIYLVRWSREDVGAGILDGMEWWSGDEMRWGAKLAGADRAVPVMRAGQTEFTVHYDEEKKLYVQTQTVGFGKAVIVQRTAANLTGPWSSKTEVFDPPQNQFKSIMIYQGKAHPYLKGADRILTYCTNSFEFAHHISEPWLYYPHFVRLAEPNREDQGKSLR